MWLRSVYRGPLKKYRVCDLSPSTSYEVWLTTDESEGGLRGPSAQFTTAAAATAVPAPEPIAVDTMSPEEDQEGEAIVENGESQQQEEQVPSGSMCTIM